ncbi:MAG: excinuclease ABC subunit UvrA [Phycisphaeraceae bacterium]|nr:excinuclease ABC subunit UvrA [Phycisphaeraceae bacterium]
MGDTVTSLDPTKCIRVRGAREHNLKSIDVDIPRDRLVVITGLSGSGKSSLAFDTIFAEGQRKYMESLSAYARQFLDQLKKPDVDDIEGLPPTIAIEQRSGTASPRSTVATTTEIYDYLRLLYARCGQPRCWHPTKVKKDGTVLERCGKPIEASSASQIVQTVIGSASSSKSPESGHRLMILAPAVRAKKGFHKEVLEDAQGKGWSRVRVNGRVLDIRETLKIGGENPMGLGRYEKHTIDVVVDRISLRPDDDGSARQRLAESIESALRLGEGTVVIAEESAPDTWTDRVFSDKFACAEHPQCALEELSPRVFSFNSPQGACEQCHGLGAIQEFEEDLVIPDKSLSISQGAVKAWKVPPPMGKFYRKRLRHFCVQFGVDPNEPVESLPAWAVRILLHGCTAEDKKEHGATFEGVTTGLRDWYQRTESSFSREWLGQFMRERECPTCHGDRLRIGSLHVLVESAHVPDRVRTESGTMIGGRRSGSDGRTALNIAQLARLTITDAAAFVAGLRLTSEHRVIAEPIVKEVLGRLGFLESVGLDYLSLDRKTGTLSGGEAQRIRLATQVGSKLVGACYVLDEPTIGLHQRDNARLIETLRKLADTGGGGNTVIVVEHDEDMIRAADWVLDIGPGPGVHGGRVVAQGPVETIIAQTRARVPRQLAASTNGHAELGTDGKSLSQTGLYLSGLKRITPHARRRLSAKRALVVKNASENNLKSIDATFPLGGLICVTGVSGSGKSTLVNDILLRGVKRELLGSKDRPGKHQKIVGLKHVDRVIEVDQSPIGRTPRSNPATYTGIFDEIRRVFAATKESKIRGYQPGRFSFNVRSQAGGGRCEACEGQGLKKIEMHFLPNVYVTCEACGGKRYNRETLEVAYRGKSIADVLSMTVETACGFFENHPRIKRFVECLRDVGLGYLELGQPSTTLSGGEAQRVKLATELGKTGGSLPNGNRPIGRETEDEKGLDEEELDLPAAGSKQPAVNGGAHTLYVLDEPTTGLHFEDVRKLLGVLDRLADAGSTLVVIEHNLDVIKCADWIIDLGPEGGDKGGTIVCEGTPDDVMRHESSYTGRHLKQHLEAEMQRSRLA